MIVTPQRSSQANNGLIKLLSRDETPSESSADQMKWVISLLFLSMGEAAFVVHDLHRVESRRERLGRKGVSVAGNSVDPYTDFQDVNYALTGRSHV